MLDLTPARSGELLNLPGDIGGCFARISNVVAAPADALYPARTLQVDGGSAAAAVAAARGASCRFASGSAIGTLTATVTASHEVTSGDGIALVHVAFEHGSAPATVFLQLSRDGITWTLADTLDVSHVAISALCTPKQGTRGQPGTPVTGSSLGPGVTLVAVRWHGDELQCACRRATRIRVILAGWHPSNARRLLAVTSLRVVAARAASLITALKGVRHAAYAVAPMTASPAAGITQVASAPMTPIKQTAHSPSMSIAPPYSAFLAEALMTGSIGCIAALASAAIRAPDADGGAALRALRISRAAIDAVRKRLVERHTSACWVEALDSETVDPLPAFDPEAKSSNVVLSAGGATALSVEPEPGAATTGYALGNRGFALLPGVQHSWTFRLDADRHADECVTFGCGVRPVRDAHYENTADVWSVRCYNGRIYGRVPSRGQTIPGGAIHRGSLLNFTLDGGTRAVSLNVDGVSQGVVFVLPSDDELNASARAAQLVRSRLGASAHDADQIPPPLIYPAVMFYSHGRAASLLDVRSNACAVPMNPSLPPLLCRVPLLENYRVRGTSTSASAMDATPRQVLGRLALAWDVPPPLDYRSLSQQQAHSDRSSRRSADRHEGNEDDPSDASRRGIALASTTSTLSSQRSLPLPGGLGDLEALQRVVAQRTAWGTTISVWPAADDEEGSPPPPSGRVAIDRTLYDACISIAPDAPTLLNLVTAAAGSAVMRSHVLDVQGVLAAQMDGEAPTSQSLRTESVTSVVRFGIGGGFTTLSFGLGLQDGTYVADGNGRTGAGDYIGDGDSVRALFGRGDIEARIYADAGEISTPGRLVFTSQRAFPPPSRNSHAPDTYTVDISGARELTILVITRASAAAASSRALAVTGAQSSGLDGGLTPVLHGGCNSEQRGEFIDAAHAVRQFINSVKLPTVVFTEPRLGPPPAQALPLADAVISDACMTVDAADAIGADARAVDRGTRIVVAGELLRSAFASGSDASRHPHKSCSDLGSSSRSALHDDSSSGVALSTALYRRYVELLPLPQLPNSLHAMLCSADTPAASPDAMAGGQASPIPPLTTTVAVPVTSSTTDTRSSGPDSAAAAPATAPLPVPRSGVAAFEADIARAIALSLAETPHSQVLVALANPAVVESQETHALSDASHLVARAAPEQAQTDGTAVLGLHRPAHSNATAQTPPPSRSESDSGFAVARIAQSEEVSARDAIAVRISTSAGNTEAEEQSDLACALELSMGGSHAIVADAPAEYLPPHTSTIVTSSTSQPQIHVSGHDNDCDAGGSSTTNEDRVPVFVGITVCGTTTVVQIPRAVFCCQSMIAEPPSATTRDSDAQVQRAQHTVNELGGSDPVALVLRVIRAQLSQPPFGFLSSAWLPQRLAELCADATDSAESVRNDTVVFGPVSGSTAATSLQAKLLGCNCALLPPPVALSSDFAFDAAPESVAAHVDLLDDIFALASISTTPEVHMLGALAAALFIVTSLHGALAAISCSGVSIVGFGYDDMLLKRVRCALESCVARWSVISAAIVSDPTTASVTRLGAAIVAVSIDGLVVGVPVLLPSPIMRLDAAVLWSGAAHDNTKARVTAAVLRAVASDVMDGRIFPCSDDLRAPAVASESLALPLSLLDTCIGVVGALTGDGAVELKAAALELLECVQRRLFLVMARAYLSLGSTDGEQQNDRRIAGGAAVAYARWLFGALPKASCDVHRRLLHPFLEAMLSFAHDAVVATELLPLLKGLLSYLIDDSTLSHAQPIAAQEMWLHPKAMKNALSTPLPGGHRDNYSGQVGYIFRVTSREPLRVIALGRAVSRRVNLGHLQRPHLVCLWSSTSSSLLASATVDDDCPRDRCGYASARLNVPVLLQPGASYRITSVEYAACGDPWLDDASAANAVIAAVGADGVIDIVGSCHADVPSWHLAPVHASGIADDADSAAVAFSARDATRLSTLPTTTVVRGELLVFSTASGPSSISRREAGYRSILGGATFFFETFGTASAAADDRLQTDERDTSVRLTVAIAAAAAATLVADHTVSDMEEFVSPWITAIAPTASVAEITASPFLMEKVRYFDAVTTHEPPHLEVRDATSPQDELDRAGFLLALAVDPADTCSNFLSVVAETYPAVAAAAATWLALTPSAGAAALLEDWLQRAAPEPRLLRRKQAAHASVSGVFLAALLSASGAWREARDCLKVLAAASNSVTSPSDPPVPASLLAAWTRVKAMRQYLRERWSAIKGAEDAVRLRTASDADVTLIRANDAKMDVVGHADDSDNDHISHSTYNASTIATSNDQETGEILEFARTPATFAAAAAESITPVAVPALTAFDSRSTHADNVSEASVSQVRLLQRRRKARNRQLVWSKAQPTTWLEYVASMRSRCLFLIACTSDTTATATSRPWDDSAPSAAIFRQILSMSTSSGDSSSSGSDDDLSDTIHMGGLGVNDVCSDVLAAAEVVAAEAPSLAAILYAKHGAAAPPQLLLDALRRRKSRVTDRKIGLAALLDVLSLVSPMNESSPVGRDSTAAAAAAAAAARIAVQLHSALIVGAAASDANITAVLNATARSAASSAAFFDTTLAAQPSLFAAIADVPRPAQQSLLSLLDPSPSPASSSPQQRGINVGSEDDAFSLLRRSLLAVRAPLSMLVTVPPPPMAGTWVVMNPVSGLSQPAIFAFPAASTNYSALRTSTVLQYGAGVSSAELCGLIRNLVERMDAACTRLCALWTPLMSIEYGDRQVGADTELAISVLRLLAHAPADAVLDSGALPLLQRLIFTPLRPHCDCSDASTKSSVTPSLPSIVANSSAWHRRGSGVMRLAAFPPDLVRRRLASGELAKSVVAAALFEVELSRPQAIWHSGERGDAAVTPSQFAASHTVTSLARLYRRVWTRLTGLASTIPTTTDTKLPLSVQRIFATRSDGVAIEACDAADIDAAIMSAHLEVASRRANLAQATHALLARFLAVFSYAGASSHVHALWTAHSHAQLLPPHAIMTSDDAGGEGGRSAAEQRSALSALDLTPDTDAAAIPEANRRRIDPESADAVLRRGADAAEIHSGLWRLSIVRAADAALAGGVWLRSQECRLLRWASNALSDVIIEAASVIRCHDLRIIDNEPLMLLRIGREHWLAERVLHQALILLAQIAGSPAGGCDDAFPESPFANADVWRALLHVSLSRASARCASLSLRILALVLPRVSTSSALSSAMAVGAVSLHLSAAATVMIGMHFGTSNISHNMFPNMPPSGEPSTASFVIAHVLSLLDGWMHGPILFPGSFDSEQGKSLHAGTVLRSGLASAAASSLLSHTVAAVDVNKICESRDGPDARSWPLFGCSLDELAAARGCANDAVALLRGLIAGATHAWERKVESNAPTQCGGVSADAQFAAVHCVFGAIFSAASLMKSVTTLRATTAVHAMTTAASLLASERSGPAIDLSVSLPPADSGEVVEPLAAVIRSIGTAAGDSWTADKEAAILRLATAALQVLATASDTTVLHDGGRVIVRGSPVISCDLDEDVYAPVGVGGASLDATATVVATGAGGTVSLVPDTSLVGCGGFPELAAAAVAGAMKKRGRWGGRRTLGPGDDDGVASVTPITTSAIAGHAISDMLAGTFVRMSPAIPRATLSGTSAEVATLAGAVGFGDGDDCGSGAPLSADILFVDPACLTPVDMVIPPRATMLHSMVPRAVVEIATLALLQADAGLIGALEPENCAGWQGGLRPRVVSATVEATVDGDAQPVPSLDEYTTNRVALKLAALSSLETILAGDARARSSLATIAPKLRATSLLRQLMDEACTPLPTATFVALPRLRELARDLGCLATSAAAWEAATTVPMIADASRADTRAEAPTYVRMLDGSPSSYDDIVMIPRLPHCSWQFNSGLAASSDAEHSSAGSPASREAVANPTETARRVTAGELAQLGLGFDIDACIAALRRFGDDPQRTVEWLLTSEAHSILAAEESARLAEASGGSDGGFFGVNSAAGAGAGGIGVGAGKGGASAATSAGTAADAAADTLERARLGNAETLAAVWGLPRELAYQALLLQGDDVNAAANWLIEPDGGGTYAEAYFTGEDSEDGDVDVTVVEAVDAAQRAEPPDASSVLEGALDVTANAGASLLSVPAFVPLQPPTLGGAARGADASSNDGAHTMSPKPTDLSGTGVLSAAVIAEHRAAVGAPLVWLSSIPEACIQPSTVAYAIPPGTFVALTRYVGAVDGLHTPLRLSRKIGIVVAARIYPVRVDVADVRPRSGNQRQSADVRVLVRFPGQDGNGAPAIRCVSASHLRILSRFGGRLVPGSHNRLDATTAAVDVSGQLRSLLAATELAIGVHIARRIVAAIVHTWPQNAFNTSPESQCSIDEALGGNDRLIMLLRLVAAPIVGPENTADNIVDSFDGCEPDLDNNDHSNVTLLLVPPPDEATTVTVGAPAAVRGGAPPEARPAASPAAILVRACDASPSPHVSGDTVAHGSRRQSHGATRGAATSPFTPHRNAYLGAGGGSSPYLGVPASPLMLSSASRGQRRDSASGTPQPTPHFGEDFYLGASAGSRTRHCITGDDEVVVFGSDYLHSASFLPQPGLPLMTILATALSRRLANESKALSATAPPTTIQALSKNMQLVPTANVATSACINRPEAAASLSHFSAAAPPHAPLDVAPPMPSSDAETSFTLLHPIPLATGRSPMGRPPLVPSDSTSGARFAASGASFSISSPSALLPPRRTVVQSAAPQSPQLLSLLSTPSLAALSMQHGATVTPLFSLDAPPAANDGLAEVHPSAHHVVRRSTRISRLLLEQAITSLIATRNKDIDTSRVRTAQSLHPIPPRADYMGEIAIDGAKALRVVFDWRCDLGDDASTGGPTALLTLYSDRARTSVVATYPARRSRTGTHDNSGSFPQVIVHTGRLFFRFIANRRSGSAPAWGYRFFVVPMSGLTWVSEVQAVNEPSLAWAVWMITFLLRDAARLNSQDLFVTCHHPRVVAALTGYLRSPGSPSKAAVVGLLTLLLQHPAAMAEAAAAPAPKTYRNAVDATTSDSILNVIEPLVAMADVILARVGEVLSRGRIFLPSSMLALVELSTAVYAAQRHFRETPGNSVVSDATATGGSEATRSTSDGAGNEPRSVRRVLLQQYPSVPAADDARAVSAPMLRVALLDVYDCTAALASTSAVSVDAFTAELAEPARVRGAVAAVPFPDAILCRAWLDSSAYVLTRESSHPFRDGEVRRGWVVIPGAVTVRIVIDRRTSVSVGSSLKFWGPSGGDPLPMCGVMAVPQSEHATEERQAPATAAGGPAAVVVTETTSTSTLLADYLHVENHAASMPPLQQAGDIKSWLQDGGDVMTISGDRVYFEFRAPNSANNDADLAGPTSAYAGLESVASDGKPNAAGLWGFLFTVSATAWRTAPGTRASAHFEESILLGSAYDAVGEVARTPHYLGPATPTRPTLDLDGAARAMLTWPRALDELLVRWVNAHSLRGGGIEDWALTAGEMPSASSGSGGGNASGGFLGAIMQAGAGRIDTTASGMAGGAAAVPEARTSSSQSSSRRMIVFSVEMHPADVRLSPREASETYAALASIPLPLIHMRLALLRYYNRRLMRVLELIDFSAAVATDAQVSVDIGGGGGSMRSLASAPLAAGVAAVSHAIFADLKFRLLEAGIGATWAQVPRGAVRPVISIDNVRAAIAAEAGAPDPASSACVLVQAFRGITRAMSNSPASVTALFRAPRDDRGRIFAVRNVAEDAIDYGGVFQSTATLMVEDAFSRRLDLLLPVPNAVDGDPNYLPNPRHFRGRGGFAASLLCFLGKLMGLSLRNRMQLPFSWPRLVWKALVGEPLQFDDLREIDSRATALVVAVTHWNPSSECTDPAIEFASSFPGLTFGMRSLHDANTVGAGPTRSMSAHGDQRVTLANRKAFVAELLGSMCSEHDAALRLLRRGLYSVVPGRHLRALTWRELELAVAGRPEIDISIVRAHTDLDGYRRDDVTVILYWRVLESLSQEDRSLWLRFVWGRNRLPTSRRWPRRLKLQRRQCGEDQLPLSHTCFGSVEVSYHAVFTSADTVCTH